MVLVWVWMRVLSSVGAWELFENPGSLGVWPRLNSRRILLAGDRSRHNSQTHRTPSCCLRKENSQRFWKFCLHPKCRRIIEEPYFSTDILLTLSIFMLLVLRPILSCAFIFSLHPKLIEEITEAYSTIFELENRFLVVFFLLQLSFFSIFPLFDMNIQHPLVYSSPIVEIYLKTKFS